MAEKNTKAIMKKDTVDVVAQRVRSFHETGQLHLPDNYSAENAMKSAWLIIQETKDKNSTPALDVCTKESIANALLYMVVQALNPAKKQCYFVVYGNQLVCQRSYFGSMSVAKMVDSTINDIVAEVVYEGDTFRYKIDKGRKAITDHEQDIDNVGKQIKAAYCIITDKNGQVKKTEIMTFDEIKQAWKQSKMYPVNKDGSIKKDSTHDKFAADMAKKTVINRACKPIINSSSDSNLLIKAVRHSDDIQADHDAEAEIQENANQDYIDIKPEPGTGPETDSSAPDDPDMTDEEKAAIEAEEQAQAATGTDGPDF